VARSIARPGPLVLSLPRSSSADPRRRTAFLSPRGTPPGKRSVPSSQPLAFLRQQLHLAHHELSVAQQALAADVARCVAASQVRYHSVSRATPLKRGPLGADAKMNGKLAKLFLVAVGIVLFAVPYPYCMDGYGYGFPFAWFHPGHGERFAIPVHPDEKLSDIIDIENIIVSTIIFASIAGAVAWFRRRA
jgi:hypothetical protein